MTFYQAIVSIIIAIIAASAGGFGFAQFLIKRKDDQKKENIDIKINDTKAELKQHLVDVNAQWKLDYCDKNAEAIHEISGVAKDLKDNVVLLTGITAEMKKYNETVGAAINGIIHDRIIHNVDNYIDRKAITIEELSTLKSMYYPYKQLGGNGDVETAFEQASKLPVITKDEACDMDIELRRKKYSVDNNI